MWVDWIVSPLGRVTMIPLGSGEMSLRVCDALSEIKWPVVPVSALASVGWGGLVKEGGVKVASECLITLTKST